MINPLSFTCPCCGNPGIRFSLWQCLRQTAKSRCFHCGTDISSDLGTAKYVALLFYSSIVSLVFALPIVLTLAGQRWIIGLTFLLLYLALLFIPAMVAHAKNAAKTFSAGR